MNSIVIAPSILSLNYAAEYSAVTGGTVMEIKLSPSILSADFANLARDIKIATDAGAEYVHVDVMDGHFVPNLTFGPDILRGFKKACPLFMDVHLMVEDPETYAPIFIKNGADLVTFHTEALNNDLTRIQKLLDEIHGLGAKGGIVVKPNTAIEPFENVLKSCDLVLIMSVEPGFGGQKFMADMLKKVEWLKEKREALNLSYRIEIDGGINQDTFRLALNAGCDTLVAGSYVFKNDIAKTIEGMLE